MPRHRFDNPRGAKYSASVPCRVCGSTLRYRRGSFCVNCAQRRSAEQIERHAARNAASTPTPAE